MLRRRGLSEKGRLGLFSFFFFTLSLGLTSYTAKNPQTSSFGHSAVAEAVRPLQSATSSAYSSIVGVWDRYVHLRGVELENETLKERLATLEDRNAMLEETQRENERLQQLLGVKEEGGHDAVAASVIGYDPSSWIQAVTINRGSFDGIQIGYPVVTGSGAVGQVIAVSAQTARVLLIIDRASGVDVVIQDNRARGILEGTGTVQAKYRFVVENEDVVVGDKIVTSGMDGVFPKGISIGVVASVNAVSGALFKDVVVVPSVEFSKLEDVLVLLPRKEAEPAKAKKLAAPPQENRKEKRG